MKKTIIGLLITLLSDDEQKEITDIMLKSCYPDHHLHHNTMKRDKVDESNRTGITAAQEAGS